MRPLHIGMIGARFGGLDGVSLESVKVAKVLESLGHHVSWFAGRIGPGFTPAAEYPDAYFGTRENRALNDEVFGTSTCSAEALALLEQRAQSLQTKIAAWAEDAAIDVLMPQNALAIPMQLPLGVAIARHIKASGAPTIAHNHDFAWERERFWPNAVGAILQEAFPPVGPSIRHLVINSLAAAELQRRCGAEALVLPNIMDFANPPTAGDGRAFRRAAGLDSSRVVLLQPTRMIPRKGIEDTLRLAHRLGDPSICIVVTHPEHDEGERYPRSLADLADRLEVDFRVAPVDVGSAAGLRDAYAGADLVVYPSRIEGFGNALLEAFYFSRPILVNRYPVYRADIKSRGVVAIEMAGELTDAVVDSVALWLADPAAWSAAVEINYQVGVDSFSYEVAGEILHQALTDIHLR